MKGATFRATDRACPDGAEAVSEDRRPQREWSCEMSTATLSHMQEAEQYLMQAEDVRTAARHTGDRNAAAVSLVMIAQAHATLALVQTLKELHEDRQLLSMEA